MKRIHIHIAVKQLEENIRFYSTLFGVPPTVKRDDYAKWKIDEPAVNFAISSRNQKPGINHLGIQVDSDSELQEIDQRLQAAQYSAVKQDNAACCYAQSNKYWALDPQGVAWESFHTLDEIPVFGNDIDTGAKEDQTACCIPTRREDQNSESDCCVPGSTAASGCCQP
ncbi:MAG: VOC family protein [Gammaproteobacteria bacterium]|nr:VOC family protein [Gammaproteobacteria bacterium]